MLTADLTVTDSGTATKPGALGAKVFALVASLVNDKTLRRIAATATTVPNEMSVQHSLTGAGFKQRCRTVVKFEIRRLDTDTSLTGGVIPSATIYQVIDRPIQSNGYITTAHLQSLQGQLTDAILASGAFDKLLNMEA
jgi:hypothetical protein